MVWHGIWGVSGMGIILLISKQMYWQARPFPRESEYRLFSTRQHTYSTPWIRAFSEVTTRWEIYRGFKKRKAIMGLPVVTPWTTPSLVLEPVYGGGGLKKEREENQWSIIELKYFVHKSIEQVNNSRLSSLLPPYGSKFQRQHFIRSVSLWG